MGWIMGEIVAMDEYNLCCIRLCSQYCLCVRSCVRVYIYIYIYARQGHVKVEFCNISTLTLSLISVVSYLGQWSKRYFQK